MKRSGGLGGQLESSGTVRTHPPRAPRPEKGRSYLQGVSFIGLNELSVNCLRLINRAAGWTQRPSCDISIPRLGEVHRPGSDPVFLCVLPAEKVTSLGKDWHRPCLRCQKCKKTLSAGSHAEVRQHHICSPGSCSRASRGVCESMDRTPLPRQQTPRVPLLVSCTESCMNFLLPAASPCWLTRVL